MRTRCVAGFACRTSGSQVAERQGEPGRVHRHRSIDKAAASTSMRARSSPSVARLMLDAAGDRGSHRSAKPRVRAFVQGDDSAARQFFADADDWRVIRHAFQMRIELDGELPEPAWHDGLTLTHVADGEEAARLRPPTNEAFAGPLGIPPAAVRGVDGAPQGSAPTSTPRSGGLSSDGDEMAAVSRQLVALVRRPALGWIAHPRHAAAVAAARPRHALLLHSFRDFRERGATRVGAGRRRARTRPGRCGSTSASACTSSAATTLREGARVSRLRAQCPDCHTFTAVALGPGYECHACGREFAAGLVRVPRAWGDGGEAMAEAARLPLAVSRGRRRRGGHRSASRRSRSPPSSPSGRSCSAAAAARTSARSRGSPPATGGSRVVWFDAHGDLNTPETSPSGQLWGMPLRMLLDSRRGRAATTSLLVGARNLDPPEVEFIAADRRPHRPGASSRPRSRARTASTSRSTATCSIPASCRSSCPSRAGPRSPRSSGSSRGSATRRRCSAPA